MTTVRFSDILAYLTYLPHQLFQQYERMSLIVVNMESLGYEKHSLHLKPPTDDRLEAAYP
jgi:hypothetical protein